jgi:GNAT superfamily N-acetyltransferase
LQDELVEIHCRCSPKLAASRFMRRTRHPGHLDGRHTFEALLASFQTQAAHGPLGIGRTIEVDTENETNVAVLLAQIGFDPNVTRHSETSDSQARRSNAAPQVLAIIDVDPQGGDALALLREASVDAKALYPELFPANCPPTKNAPLQERSVYVIAYLAGLPLACGALRPLDKERAEIRRIYVHRDHRRTGLARAVLAHIESEALRLGYSELTLETGYKQTAAMRLYESCGFQRIAPFGEYESDPTSVCYGRKLIETVGKT